MGKDSLLERAAAILKRGMLEYRDAKLEVGELLLAYLQGRGSASRAEAVETAAMALRVRRRDVNLLVSVAVAVDLLSDDSDVGDLPYSVLRRFCILVDHDQRSDEWSVREPVDLSVDLFRRAVLEDWNEQRALQELPRRYAVRKVTVDTSLRLDVRSQFALSVAHGTVKDAAEMLVGVVCSSVAPVALAEELLRRVQEESRRVVL